MALRAWWGSPVPHPLPAGPGLLSLGLSAKPHYSCSSAIYSLLWSADWLFGVDSKAALQGNFISCLYPGCTLELCHKPIFSLLSWLCFLAGCCHWLFISLSLGLSMDSITTTSPVLFRQCGASFRFPSFSPWRSPALSAPWWVASLRIYVCPAPWELLGSLPLVKVWPFHVPVPCSLLKESSVCLNISLLHMVPWAVGFQKGWRRSLFLILLRFECSSWIFLFS